MARRKSSFYFQRNRIRKSRLRSVVEEIGEGEDAEARPMKTPRIPRSRALASIASFIPASMRSPNSSPSSSPSKSPAKLLEEDSQPDTQPPPVPTKLSKYDDRGVPTRKPPPPPPQYSQPRSSSAPRPENTSSRLRKPDSPSRHQPRADPHAIPEPVRRERSSSLAPPVSHNGGQGGVVSSPTKSRPTSYHSDQEANRAGRLSKRKSWLGLSRSRNASQDLDLAHLPAAWVEMEGQKMDYNLAFLTDGLKV